MSQLSPRSQVILALDDLREAFVKARRLAKQHGLPDDRNGRRGTANKLDVYLQRYCNETRNLAYEKLEGPKGGQPPGTDANVPHHD